MRFTDSNRQFRLTKHKRLACITCHNLTHKRFDTESWRAQSLYESMFKKQKQYKTFYLEINNRKGKLCKQCH
jgi:ribosomal protein L37AE/L43A